ncbi:hypothetical protein ACOMHN_010934 [Nucella lapillus]
MEYSERCDTSLGNSENLKTENPNMTAVTSCVAAATHIASPLYLREINRRVYRECVYREKKFRAVKRFNSVPKELQGPMGQILAAQGALFFDFQINIRVSLSAEEGALFFIKGLRVEHNVLKEARPSMNRPSQ